MLRRVLAAVSLFVLSCSSKENAVNIDQSASGSVKNLGMACDASKDDGFCGAGACVAGLCRVPCETDAACEAGSICITEPTTKLGGCRLPSEAECTSSCPSALLKCGVDGTCRSPCTDKVACPRADQKCVEGTCFSGGDCTKEQLGTYRCEGTSLQVCGASWTTVEDCVTPGLCQASLSSGKCAAAACTPGQASCKGATLRTCNADRTDFEEKDCETAALCQQGLGSNECMPAACEPGEKKCDDAVLRSCNADQTGFDQGAQCASAALCQQGIAGGSCPTPACQPNGRKCEGNVLKVCNASRTGFDTQATCGTPELCTAGLQLGACKDAVCQPGDLACDGPFLLACNEGQTGWATKYACASQSLCLSTVANAGGQIPGECTPAACKPGEYRCQGAELQTCKYDQSAFVAVATCVSMALCEKGTLMGACPPPACDAGDTQCDGPKFFECRKDQTGYVQTATCYSEALCNQGQVLDPPACKPETCVFGKCTGNVLEPCRADGTTYVTPIPCSTPELCALGMETPYTNPSTAELERYGVCPNPACAENSIKMSKEAGVWTVSQCNKGRTGFDTTVCKDGQIPLCTASAGLGWCSLSVPSFTCCLSTLNMPAPSTTITCGEPFAAPAAEVSIAVGANPTFTIDSYPASKRQFGDWAATMITEMEGLTITWDTTGLPAICSAKQYFLPTIFGGGSSLPIDTAYQYADWCDAYAYCAGKGRRLCGRVPDGGALTAAELSVTGQDEWYHVCSQAGATVYSYGNTYSQPACSSLMLPDTTCRGTGAPFDSVHLMSAALSEWSGTCAAGKCLLRTNHYGGASGETPYKCSYTSQMDLGSPKGAIRCCSTVP